jgi:hypothetical protein
MHLDKHKIKVHQFYIQQIGNLGNNNYKRTNVFLFYVFTEEFYQDLLSSRHWCVFYFYLHIEECGAILFYLPIGRSAPTVLSTRPSFLDLSEDRNFAASQVQLVHFPFGSPRPEMSVNADFLPPLSGLRSLSQLATHDTTTRGSNLRYPMHRNAETRDLASSRLRYSSNPTDSYFDSRYLRRRTSDGLCHLSPTIFCGPHNPRDRRDIAFLYLATFPSKSWSLTSRTPNVPIHE